MRRARVTYPGAFHHAMARGIEGKKIFKKDDDKLHLLELIRERKAKLRVRIFAYCLMDNHYHLVMENSSGQMSQFFRQLNGQYGAYFRKKSGGSGYVFQNRFKSIIIQDESYLKQVMAYVLANPVRAGLCERALKYPWSSASAYFARMNLSELVDIEFVRGLFGDKQSLQEMMALATEPQVLKTRVGQVIGGKEFLKSAFVKFDRRKGNRSLERNRRLDRYFEPLAKVLQEFKQKFGVDPEEINATSHAGKRLRGELLIRLKDACGLTYGEIAKMDVFSDVQVTSLGRLYHYAKERRQKS